MNNKFPSGIIDIKFSMGKVYLLKEHRLTLANIEKQLSAFTYTGQNKIVSEEVENMVFEPFALSFYNFVFDNYCLPSEGEFIDSYVANYFTSLNETQYLFKPLSKEYTLDKESVHARILRTYPSLIRDLHFYLMCVESKLFENVNYSLKRDYFEGVDILIKRDGVEYSISLMVKTERSTHFKIRKYSRHDYSDLHEIVLEIDLTNCKKVSNFFLYPESVLQKMLAQMK